MNWGSPSQQIFGLEVFQLNPNRAVLCSPSGRLVIVDAPPGCPGESIIQEFQAKFTAKDLGIQARVLMGLAGYTPIWQTTRILYQGDHLPMHQPVATLCPGAAWNRVAGSQCTFCYSVLCNRQGWVGPFENCWYCMDSPTWHHGICCPHNPRSIEWNGTPHHQQYYRGLRSFLRTLPF